MSMNLPNQITIARLVVSLIVFVLIPLKQFSWALGFFLLAATTDWLDGYLARKHGLVTQLGRILDPFADKILISGAFIFLAAEPGSQIAAWMAVVVVGRELLVTALRSFLEQQGADFSAKMAGKLKMVFQCAAVALSRSQNEKTNFSFCRNQYPAIFDNRLFLHPIDRDAGKSTRVRNP